MSKKGNSTQYFFILGNNPALSLAEIFGLFNSENSGEPCGASNKTKIITFCKDFLIIELNKKIDVDKLMAALGGTIKIGVVLENKNLNIEARDLIEKINIHKNKKFYFGFSAYGKSNTNFKKLAMEIKKELKQEGVSSRWVISREKQLSSVVVKKNKLVNDNGAEWCVLKNEDKIFWGRTLAVQEFEDYGQRDFDRPARDAKSGMIPPKLAKMMINLARAELDYKTKNNITLLDPFCGSGTILQEAAILGVDKLIGSDLSEKAVRDSKQNLEWLEGRINSTQPPNGRLRRSSSVARVGAATTPHLPAQRAVGLNLEIFKCDVRKLSGLISENYVDLIVTEPYLGPPLEGKESENKINQTVQELSELYLSAFEEFKKILKKGGCVCMVWPVFSTYEKNIFLPIFDEVKKMGFRQVKFDADNYSNLIFNDECKAQYNLTPAPQSPNGRLRRSGGGIFDDGDELKNFKKKFADNFSERGNIIYGREGQMVKREIAVFRL